MKREKKTLATMLAVCFLLSSASTVGFAAMPMNDGQQWDIATQGTLILEDSEGTCNGHHITGITDENQIQVKSGTHDVTLKDSTIDLSGAKNISAFEVESGAAVNLTLRGGNILKSGKYKAGLQVPKEAALTITDSSQGSINAMGGENGAGIGGESGAGVGGGNNGAAGTIQIDGGTVIAAGGENGAGIGSGYGGNGGKVIINGGSILAKGGSGGEDIGVGDNGSGGTLQNSKLEDVSLYTLTVNGITAETPVLDLWFNPGYDYGMTGVKTDKDGKLYVYLPDTQKEAAVMATMNESSFMGTIANREAILLALLTVKDGDFSLMKQYDGTNNFTAANATGTLELTGVSADDQVSLDIVDYGKSSDANVGTDKKMDLSFVLGGKDADKYSIASSTYTFTKAAIMPKPVTVQAFCADKVEDGTNTATVTEIKFEGLAEGESLYSGTDYTVTANFEDAGVQKDKTVNITLTPVSTSGKVQNYEIPVTATAKASITKKDQLPVNPPTTSGMSTSPKTGDDSSLGWFTILLGAGFSGIVGILLYRKRILQR